MVQLLVCVYREKDEDKEDETQRETDMRRQWNKIKTCVMSCAFNVMSYGDKGMACYLTTIN